MLARNLDSFWFSEDYSSPSEMRGPSFAVMIIGVDAESAECQNASIKSENKDEWE
jgi:hypothetical protein